MRKMILHWSLYLFQKVLATPAVDADVHMDCRIYFPHLILSYNYVVVVFFSQSQHSDLFMYFYILLLLIRLNLLLLMVPFLLPS